MVYMTYISSRNADRDGLRSSSESAEIGGPDCIHLADAVFIFVAPLCAGLNALVLTRAELSVRELDLDCEVDVEPGEGRDCEEDLESLAYRFSTWSLALMKIVSPYLSHLNFPFSQRRQVGCLSS